MATAPDDDPLARYRHGEPEAFAELVATFRDRLLQFFLRTSRDPQLAEDLTQEVFVKLLRAAARYRANGRLSVYVFRIARNLWIDHYRRQALRPRTVSADQRPLGWQSWPGTEPMPLVAAALRDDTAAMHRALADLSQDHQAVLELAVFQELPYADVAAVLDIPIGTVKSRVHHAIGQLRELLQPERLRRAMA
jgi:RNA polymerase sigma-70 factor (ECF subfamily)